MYYNTNGTLILDSSNIMAVSEAMPLEKIKKAALIQHLKIMSILSNQSFPPDAKNKFQKY